MHEIHTESIRTDVTALKIHHECILAGIGDELHVFSANTHELLIRRKLFDGVKVYGIDLCVTRNEALFHAENQLARYEIDFDALSCLKLGEYNSSDWILATKSIDADQHVVNVSMHNIVEFLDYSLQLIRRITSDESCIIYCAKIAYNKWNELVVLAGTVFAEVLLWKPADKSQIIKRLKSHSGVLFWIDYIEDGSYIATCSDDKTTILWHVDDSNLITSNITPRCKFTGHNSRIFRCKLLDNGVLSLGEDGVLNLYDFDGVLLKRHELHLNGTIWSCDVDFKRNAIITGGADGGITSIPLQQRFDDYKLILKGIVPKKVVILSNSDLVLVDELGALYYFAWNTKQWSLIHQNNEFKSYALLETSACRNKFSLAGYFGDIFIYSTNNKVQLTVRCQTEEKQRIYSLHWLLCDHLLTSSENGLLQLWTITNDNLTLITSFILPKSKERWSTSACFYHEHLVVGDRKGNIFLYDLGVEEPIQSIKKAHNHLGVTKLEVYNHILHTLGRNFRLKTYKLVDNALVLITDDKLPFSWLTALYKRSDSLLISGFSGANFVLYEYNTRRLLLSNDCSGGHRSWDLLLNNMLFMQCYIKDKAVFVSKADWPSILITDLQHGVASGEINALVNINSLLIFGGEDTVLRMSNQSAFKAHLSSIKCLHVEQQSDWEWFLFSGGGRAQIIAWKVTLRDGKFTCDELHAYYECNTNVEDSEVRITCLATTRINNEHCLLAGCSNGDINIFNLHNNKLVLTNHLTYKHCCILKMAVIRWNDCEVLLTMATDGLIAFWKLLNQEPFHTIRAHKSGINSFSYQPLNNRFLFLTGGDDASFSINFIEFALNEENVLTINELASISNDRVHCAQVSAVYLSNDLFFTAGLDQILCVWKFTIDDNRINYEYCRCYNLAIADLKGMTVDENDNFYKVVLYGLGMQILRINKV